MNKKILIKNVLLHKNSEHKNNCDIIIENAKINLASTSTVAPDGALVFNAKNCMALPSFIDMQVHLRAPGQEEKEDLQTGTKAAAKGGYTHVACMPNTRPTLDNEKYISWIHRQVQDKKTFAHIYPIAAMTENIAGKVLANYEAFKKMGVIAITDDGYGVQDDLVMEDIFKKAHEHNLILMQHCEYEHLSNKASFHEGIFSREKKLVGYPSSAEYKMIERDLKLVEKYRVPYHVLHVSTKESIDLVKAAKAKGLPVTCEVTPHHLLLCDEDIKQPYAQYKMNPPLRGKDDRLALQVALADGTIDIVSTDHAPHTTVEKNREFDLAPFGIIGLEFAWALLYTNLYLKDKISLERLIEAFSYKAREIFSLPIASINNNQTANLTLIAPQYKKLAKKEELYSKSNNTPFLGFELSGWPVLTIWDGDITYQDDTFWRNQNA